MPGSKNSKTHGPVVLQANVQDIVGELHRLAGTIKRCGGYRKAAGAGQSDAPWQPGELSHRNSRV